MWLHTRIYIQYLNSNITIYKLLDSKIRWQVQSFSHVLFSFLLFVVKLSIRYLQSRTDVSEMFILSDVHRSCAHSLLKILISFCVFFFTISNKWKHTYTYNTHMHICMYIHGMGVRFSVLFCQVCLIFTQDISYLYNIYFYFLFVFSFFFLINSRTGY